MAMDGYLALVLHAHLPFVRHPEYSEFLEEDWLFEAITETYLPLLESYESLWDDQVDFRISMTLSPPLLSMLNDGLLRERYVKRLHRLIELTEREIVRHKNDGHMTYLAQWYRDHFRHRLWQYETLYQRDLVGAFRKFVERGRLEVLTCGATHGFLPLMADFPEAIRGQLEVAVGYHESCFGQAPRGIWLPECAYYPGLDQHLRDVGLRYFIGESHAIAHAVPKPRDGIYAPIYTPSGVAVFSRDQVASAQVWSSRMGYPGDSLYREFYRDVGYDAPFDYIRPYVQPTGLRKNLGIKYHRITGEGDHKALYNPYEARQRAAEHAAHFTNGRRDQLAELRQSMGREALVVAPYDAELFGHWWFEGPWFLDVVLRQITCDHPNIALTTPTEYLQRHPTQQVAQPPMSTWGARGYAEVWLNVHNDWVYPHLHAMAERMTRLADQFPTPNDLERRALNQAARELLLAQSSDWPFIITQETSVEYAEQRLRDHIVRFNKLYEQLTSHGIEGETLTLIESRDNIFPDIDYRIWRSR